jgi:hypothetical protein
MTRSAAHCGHRRGGPTGGPPARREHVISRLGVRDKIQAPAQAPANAHRPGAAAGRSRSESFVGVGGVLGIEELLCLRVRARAIRDSPQAGSSLGPRARFALRRRCERRRIRRRAAAVQARAFAGQRITMGALSRRMRPRRMPTRVANARAASCHRAEVALASRPAEPRRRRCRALQRKKGAAAPFSGDVGNYFTVWASSSLVLGRNVPPSLGR